jgi:hypothetical protein
MYLFSDSVQRCCLDNEAILDLNKKPNQLLSSIHFNNNAFHRDLAVKMEICKTITMLHVLQQMIFFLPKNWKINNWEIKKLFCD